MVPFWCLLSGGAPVLWEGAGDCEAFLSWGEGEGVDAALLSSGDCAGLGRPFRADGDAAGRGAEDASAAPPPRPFSSFSPERWDGGGGAEDGGLREEGGAAAAGRACEAESDWLRQDIFSRLTTGRDTLRRKRGLREGNEDPPTPEEERAPTTSCSALPSVGRRRAAPC